MSAWLAAYGAAWRLALGPLRAAAGLDASLRRNLRRGCLPPEWRSRDRLLLGPAPVRVEAPAVWLHGASLGEAKGMWALAQALLRPGPEPAFRLVLTSNTAAGLGWLEGRARAEAEGGSARVAVAAAPLDHPGIVDRFLDRHGVAALCLYEAEIWPHYILRASARRIPAWLASGRMAERSFARYRRLRGTWAGVLDRLAGILAQGEDDAARFRELTRAPVAVGGDFKAAHFLRDAEGRPDGAGDPGRLAFLSLHLSELEGFLPELPGLMERFGLTVLPRRPEEFAAFRRLLRPRGFALHGEDSGARHVLVDALGRVGDLLPACGSAFVGGTLIPIGGHNLWEPLAAGCRVYFGPHTFNQEASARRLLAGGLATRIREPSEARRWRAPEPGTAAACRRVVADELRFLEESEAALRTGIANAISPFYLFSGS